MVKVDELVEKVKEDPLVALSVVENVTRFFDEHPDEVFRKHQVVDKFEDYINPNTLRVTIDNLLKKRLIGRKVVGGRTYFGSLKAISRLEEGLRD